MPDPVVRNPLRTPAKIVGTAFLAVGILSLIPGLTTHYTQFGYTGPHSRAALLGILEVSVPLDILHLGFGVAGLLAARAPTTARTFLIGGGSLYLLVVFLDRTVGHTPATNGAPVDHLGAWLQIAVAATMITLGAALGRHRSGITTGSTAVSPRSAPNVPHPHRDGS